MEIKKMSTFFCSVSGVIVGLLILLVWHIGAIRFSFDRIANALEKIADKK